MREETKELKLKFKEYYECPNHCGAVYHVSCIDRRPFECRDCKTISHVPKEIKVRDFRKERKESPSGGNRRS